MLLSTSRRPCILWRQIAGLSRTPDWTASHAHKLILSNCVNTKPPPPFGRSNGCQGWLIADMTIESQNGVYQHSREWHMDKWRLIPEIAWAARLRYVQRVLNAVALTEHASALRGGVRCVLSDNFPAGNFNLVRKINFWWWRQLGSSVAGAGHRTLRQRRVRWHSLERWHRL